MILLNSCSISVNLLDELSLHPLKRRWHQITVSHKLRIRDVPPLLLLFASLGQPTHLSVPFDTDHLLDDVIMDPDQVLQRQANIPLLLFNLVFRDDLIRAITTYAACPSHLRSHGSGLSQSSPISLLISLY